MMEVSLTDSPSHHPTPSASCLLPTLLLPTAYSLQPTAYCLLPTACFLLPTSYCLLPAAHCLLPTAYCLLPTAYSLPTACCLLPTQMLVWLTGLGALAMDIFSFFALRSLATSCLVTYEAWAINRATVGARASVSSSVSIGQQC